jgi:transcriptional regulator of acetoin/glycerol metabolism
LHNALAYASAVCTGGLIELADLPDTLHAAHDDPHGALPADAQLLVQYLRAAQWNVTAVARQLGLARMTLYRRMKRWRIEPPNRQS